MIFECCLFIVVKPKRSELNFDPSWYILAYFENFIFQIFLISQNSGYKINTKYTNIRVENAFQIEFSRLSIKLSRFVQYLDNF